MNPTQYSRSAVAHLAATGPTIPASAVWNATLPSGE